MIYSFAKMMEKAEREKALGREVLFESAPDGPMALVSTWMENGITILHHIDCEDCREKALENVPVYDSADHNMD